MAYELRDTLCAEDGEPSIAQQSTPGEQSSPVSLPSNSMCSEMSLPMLAAHCLRELDNYRRGAPAKDMYGIELFRRATIQGDPEAWIWLHHCFGGLVRGWLRCHPNRAAACHLDSEENYVALAFERFWQSTASNQRVAFSTLAAALQYLRASLHGTILDTLRAYGRPREVSLPEPGEPGEPQVEDSTQSSEVWDFLKTILTNPREQRIAYLLFHCGLKPREIMRFCPREWSSVHEIYRLRRNLLERFLRNADSLRWQLN